RLLSSLFLQCRPTTTVRYSLSLHDALPILPREAVGHILVHAFAADGRLLESGLEERAIACGLDDLRRARTVAVAGGPGKEKAVRSEEHTSELQSRVDLVCRLLLERQEHISR